LEEQAARAQTNSGYARNGTLFPQVYRAAAPPFASKKFAFHGFFPFAIVFFPSCKIVQQETKNVTPTHPYFLSRTKRMIAPEQAADQQVSLVQSPGSRAIAHAALFDLGSARFPRK
jgi:hypothetical protein